MGPDPLELLIACVPSFDPEARSETGNDLVGLGLSPTPLSEEGWRETPHQTRLFPLRAGGDAPDTSEISLGPEVPEGGLALCRLPVGGTTKAVFHPRVEELWWVKGGRGELWRRLGDTEQFAPLLPGMAVSIPQGTSFQFRSTGDATLEIVIATMPRWDGGHDAVETQGPWQPSVR